MTQHRGILSLEAPPNIVIPPDDFLTGEVAKSFTCLYEAFGRKLSEDPYRIPVFDLDLPKTHPLARKENEAFIPSYIDIFKKLPPTIEEHLTGQLLYEAQDLLNQLKALWYAHQMLVCRSYAAFAHHAHNVIRCSPRTQPLGGDTGFIKLMNMVEARQNDYPKIPVLLEQCQQTKAKRETVVVFVEDAITGRHLENFLRSKDLKAKVALPPSSRNRGSIEHSRGILALQQRQIDVLVCSSQLQQRAFDSKADRYVQFSIPYTWFQASERMLRDRWEHGWYLKPVTLVLKHPFDRQLHMRVYHQDAYPEISQNEEKKVQKPSQEPPIRPPRKKRRAAENDPNQGNLF